jgi:hypothetical protein
MNTDNKIGRLPAQQINPIEKRNFESNKSIAQIKEKSFNSLYDSLSRVGKACSAGAAFFVVGNSLGFAFPAAITVGIVAMAICFIYIKKEEKQLVQKIANYEAIAEACRRTDAQLPDQLAQSDSIEKLQEMMKAIDELCQIKNKNDTFFLSIDNGAQDLHDYYKVYESKKNLELVRKPINSTLENLKKDIQDLQKFYENLALKL